MKNKRYGIFTLFLVLVLVFALTACTSEQPAEESPAEEPAAEEPAAEEPAAEETPKEAIRIGFFSPMTGFAAADGLSTLNSAKLAIEIINESGGIDGRLIELVSYDDAVDTKQAVSIAQRLTTKDNVVAVVSGSYSGPTRVAAPIFQDAGIPMISGYAIHPDVTDSGDFVFSQSFPGQVQGKAGGVVAVDMLDAKRISIIAVDIDFGKTLAQAFKNYVEPKGAEIVSEDYFAMGDSEFAPIVTKLKNEIKPDLIYMANYYGHGAEIVRQLKSQGFDVQVLGTEGIDSYQFFEIAGESAEGVMITTNMNRDSENQATQEYIKTYTEKYGIVPDMVGASVYDAFQVLFKAIGEVGTDPEMIRDTIKDLKGFSTVTGTLIEYAPTREAIKPVQIQIIEDGAYHYYDEIDDLEIITPEPR